MCKQLSNHIVYISKTMCKQKQRKHNTQAFRVSTSRSQKCLPEDINIMTKGWGEVTSDRCVPYRRKS